MTFAQLSLYCEDPRKPATLSEAFAIAKRQWAEKQAKEKPHGI